MSAIKFCFSRRLLQTEPPKRRQRCGGLLQLHLCKAPIEEFEGDYIITSTNQRLEGIHRKNWWGFAGRMGADASLHAMYQSSKTFPDYLRKESQKQLRLSSPPSSSSLDDILPFASCLITDAGPLLKVKRVVHTCVPRYPQKEETSYLHDTLPHAWIENRENALDLLERSYVNAFENIIASEKNQVKNFKKVDDDRNLPSTRICLPAIGCGLNGYPLDDATDIALNCIHQISNKDTALTVEVRFYESKVFQTWVDMAKARPEWEFDEKH